MRVGDRGIAQRIAVFGFGVRPLDRLPLLPQDLDALVRHHDIEVALRRGQHQLLLLTIGLPPGRLRSQSQLLALRITLGVVEGLTCLQCPTPQGAVVD